jgi:hypothetical protein
VEPDLSTRTESTGDDVRDVLLDQVSRRTGYPRAMLGLDDDMEADLGIDSIKRVEILGELQTLGFVADGSDLEALSRCRTLSHIINHLSDRAPRGGRAESAWAGQVEELVAGQRFSGVLWLDAADDPIASHHTLGGRRLSAVDAERLGLPVVPFTAMVEMLAQAAAVVAPDMAVVGLRDVQASRWIPYESEPIALAFRAVREPGPGVAVRVTIHNRGARAAVRPGEEPTVSGVVRFGQNRLARPAGSELRLDDPGPCRFSAEELYGDQWLFHGPALRALERVGSSSRSGIEGTLRVLPRRDLLPERLWPTLHTDPIVLDAFTHLLGTWGIDKKAGEEGDVMFPLRVACLDFFGEDPPEGSRVECRVAVREVTRHRVRADAEILGPEGCVWVAIEGWEDWRFYWPSCYRDVFRRPDTVLIGEQLVMPGFEARSACAVWLEPPPDMLKPVWRDVLEWVEFGPDERAAMQAEATREPDWCLRVLRRIAAKEAVRRVWLSDGRPPVYPADVTVEGTLNGLVSARDIAAGGTAERFGLSTAVEGGVAVAVAVSGDEAGIGIDVVTIGADLAGEGAVPGEAEWSARHLCARTAVAKALGGDPHQEGGTAEILSGDRATGDVTVRAAGLTVTCRTVRRGEHVWGWAVSPRRHL